MRERIKDRTRLLHMLEGIDNIMEFKEGVDFETFANNKLLKFGIFYNVTISLYMKVAFMKIHG
ncbi:MAG: hypothetical protein II976_05545 [Alistipes sp.]|nr:hypothetical protein [Alistipes sp.]